MKLRHGRAPVWRPGRAPFARNEQEDLLDAKKDANGFFSQPVRFFDFSTRFNKPAPVGVTATHTVSLVPEPAQLQPARVDRTRRSAGKR